MTEEEDTYKEDIQKLKEIFEEKILPYFQKRFHEDTCDRSLMAQVIHSINHNFILAESSIHGHWWSLNEKRKKEVVKLMDTNKDFPNVYRTPLHPDYMFSEARGLPWLDKLPGGFRYRLLGADTSTNTNDVLYDIVKDN